MKPTMNGRVSTLETVYVEVIKPMRIDLKDIKSNTQKMSLEMPELLRRVGEHHAFINTLKIAKCPIQKVMPGNSEDRNRRKSDAPKFKYILWSAVITGVCGIITAIVVAILK